jgi:hypothetical protein
LGGTISWLDFIYLTLEFWITKAPLLGTKGLKEDMSEDGPKESSKSIICLNRFAIQISFVD